MWLDIYAITYIWSQLVEFQTTSSYKKSNHNHITRQNISECYFILIRYRNIIHKYWIFQLSIPPTRVKLMVYDKESMERTNMCQIVCIKNIFTSWARRYTDKSTHRGLGFGTTIASMPWSVSQVLAIVAANIAFCHSWNTGNVRNVSTDLQIRTHTRTI